MYDFHKSQKISKPVGGGLYKLNFSKTFFVLFTLSLGIFYFTNISSVQAANTYYVDATGGLDANNGTSTGAAWKTIAKVNGFTFAAGDSILFKRGETWNEQLTIPRSGTAGNPMTFADYGTGTKPIIDGQNTRDYCIWFDSRSYITINNIQVQNGKVRNIWSDGAASNINIDGVDSIGGAVGIYVRAKSNSTYRNITVSTTTGASYAYGFALQNAASNVVVDNITVTGANSSTGHGIYLGQITNLTATNLNARNNGGIGIYFIECAGTLTASNLVAGGGQGLGNSNENGGIYVHIPTTSFISMSNVTSSYNAMGFKLATIDPAGTSFLIDNLVSEHNDSTGVWLSGNISTSTVQNSISRYNGGLGSGFNIGDSTGQNPSNLSFINCVANNNNWDGFSFAGTGSDFLISKCKSYNNGRVDYPVASGDGYTSHDTVSNLKIYNSIAYDNLNSGIAFIGSASGEVYNSVFYSNGSTGFNRGGYWSQVSGGSGWVLKNNIFQDNYPREFFTDANGLSYTTANYNLYYHSADNKVASIDNGSTELSWTTYHTTNGYEANSIYGDPAFVNTATPDFHLQSTSLAINAGTNVGLTSDYDNITTPVGSGFEMGAYEYLIPFVPTIATPVVIGGSSIRWNFTDNADSETGFKLYNSDGVLISTQATPNLSYIDESGLSLGIGHTRYIKAYNAYGESSASGQTSIAITGPSRQVDSVSESTTTAISSIASTTQTTTTQQISTTTQQVLSKQQIQTLIIQIQKQLIILIGQLIQAIQQQLSQTLGH